MTRKPDEATLAEVRFPKTDCGDVVGKDDLLAMITSQCSISLPLSSSEARRLHSEVQSGPTISLAVLLAQFGASITITGESDGTWTAELVSCRGLPVLRCRGGWEWVKVNAPSLAEAVHGIAGQLEGAYFEMPTPRRWWQFLQLWIPAMPVNLTHTRVVVTEDALPIHVVVFAPRRFGKRALETARDEELDAILQVLHDDIVWHEDQWAETQDDADQRSAEALRSVTRLLEATLHRGRSPDLVSDRDSDDVRHAVRGCCRLVPGSSVQHTPREIARWANAAAAHAREVLMGEQVIAGLRPLRWGGRDILELALEDELGHSHAITFTVGAEHNFQLEEPDVPDLIDALVMAGIVVRALNASVRVGDRARFEQQSEADGEHEHARYDQPGVLVGPVLGSRHAAGCLSALDQAFVHVRIVVSDGGAAGLVAQECKRLHHLIWAVQHIPRALQVSGAETDEYAVKQCWRLEEELVRYDATWGPSSEHGRALRPAQRFAHVSLLNAYIKGRSQLRAPIDAAFVVPSCPDSLSARACLAVLDAALQVVAFGLFCGYAYGPRGLRPRACAQLHAVLDAVHNIPTALLDPGNCLWTADRLRRHLAEHDCAWGPSSPFGQQHSEDLIRPVSLQRTYDKAAACGPMSVAWE